MIKAAIELNSMDECILQLGYKTIRQNSKVLAKLYALERKNVQKALNEFDFGKNEELKQKLLSVADKRIEPAPEQAEKNYPTYTFYDAE